MMMQRALKMHTKFINQGRFFMACSAITDIGRNFLQGNFIDLAPLNPSQTLQARRILKTSCTDLRQPFWSQYFSYEKQGGLLEKKAGDLPSVHKLPLDFQQHLPSTGPLREERQCKNLNFSVLLCHRTSVALSWVHKSKDTSELVSCGTGFTVQVL